MRLLSDMKKLFFIAFGCFLLAGNIQADPPFRTKGTLDIFQINALSPTNMKYDVTFKFVEGNSQVTENYDTKGVMYKDASYQGSVFGIYSLSANNIKLSLDCRPYKDYYMDIPIQMTTPDEGTHVLSYDGSFMENTATVIEIRDSKNESKPGHNFLKSGDFRFDVVKEYTDRPDTIKNYYLRIWGADKLKEGLGTTARWNNPGNWESGVVPGNAAGKQNNYVLIPEGTQVAILPGEEYMVDTVNNEGQLDNEGKITMTGPCLNKGTINNQNSGKMVAKETIRLF